MSLMPPKTWKKIELAICRIFGGQRSGPVGKDGPDCRDTFPFAVQVKHRSCPKWLVAAMEQSVGDLPSDLWMPVVALHEKGTSIEDTMIIIPLKWFEEWYL
jgi:hypothetical protein